MVKTAKKSFLYVTKMIPVGCKPQVQLPFVIDHCSVASAVPITVLTRYHSSCPEVISDTATREHVGTNAQYIGKRSHRRPPTTKVTYTDEYFTRRVRTTQKSFVERPKYSSWMHIPNPILLVVVVVVLTLKKGLTSIQYLLFLILQGKETNFRGHKLTQNKLQLGS